MEYDRAAADRILRRASQLSTPQPGSLAASTGITEDVLVASATEVGLDPDAVRISLAIERLGGEPEPARSDRWLGVAQPVVDRVVALDSTAAIDRLDLLLVQEHQLHAKRIRPESREFHKRRGTLGAVQRAARSATTGAGLSNVARIHATASRIDGERSLVRLVADRRTQRNELAAGSAAVGVLGVAGLTVAAVAVSPLMLLAAPAVAIASFTVAVQGRRQQADLELELQSVLDAVEQGTSPVTLGDSLRRLLRSARAPR